MRVLGKPPRGGHRPTLIVRLFFILSILPVILHLTFLLSTASPITAKSIPIRLPRSSEDSSVTTVTQFSTNLSITFAIVTFGHRFSRYADTTLPNWFQTFTNSSLIIFNGRNTDVEEITKAFQKYRDRIQFGPSLDTDELGIPYVDDFVQKSFDLAASDFLCLIMQDTVLGKGFSWGIHFLNEYFSKTHRQFGAVGRRCAALDSPKKLVKTNPSLDWVSAAANEEFSNDIIFLSKRDNVLDFSEIPPFHIGMHAWDVWLVARLGERIPMVALGGDCGSIHLKHKPEPMILAKVQENYEMAGAVNAAAGLARGMKFRIVGKELLEEDRVIARCDV
jgi:hypothetical protein